MIKSLTFAVLMLCAAACNISNAPPPEDSPVREPETPTLDEPSQPTVQGPAIPSDSIKPPPEVLAGGAAPPAAESKAGGVCKTDSDCVPASCCHPTECVAKSTAPTCEGTMCTKECRAGTLDCGGSCLCQNGTCAAQLRSPSAM
jgi:hypothetical protein